MMTAANRNLWVRARGSALCLCAGFAALAAITPGAFALAPGEHGSVVTFPVSGTSDTAYAAALDPDGGIVMAGSANSGASGALARISATGAVDTLFGSTMDGIIKYNLSAATLDNERALVRTNDGHFASCGVFFSAGTATDFLTALFKSDGTLESAFNGGYAVTAYLTSGAGAALYDQCNAVGVQSDGKIVSAGYTSEAGSNRVMVTRHTSAGLLDGTFAGGGKIAIDASLNPAADSSAQAMIILPDDKILLAGNAGGTFNNIEFLLMRLNADGSPDTTFGSNGIVRTPIGTGTDIANAIALQPDGKIVVAGSSAAADTRADFAIARYDSTGTLDTATFNSPNGFVTTPIGPGEDIAYAVAVMPWGRIVAAGSARISTSVAGTDIALAAYNSNGTLDKYFGNNGKVMAQVTAVADEVIQALVTDVNHEHFWAVGAGVPVTDRDFMVLAFGLPDTIFRNGFEVPVP